MSFDFNATGVGYFPSWHYTSAEILERIDMMFDASMPLSEKPETLYDAKLFKITVTVEEV